MIVVSSVRLVSRLWRVAATGLLVASWLPVQAETRPLDLVFDQVVYGDFVVSGNTVTACPAQSPHRPPQLCRSAQDRKGQGNSAQNNGHLMAWADVDTDPGTYNSSSAGLVLPPGSRVIHATLSWAGNVAVPMDLPCGGSTVTPPGEPGTQRVSIRVNDRPAHVVAPFVLRQDPPEALQPTDERFYSARADVTAQFAGLAGGAPITVTVGNIWTPQGRDCFGGWSVTAVWAFDEPQPELAPARRHVQLYDGHTRVGTDDRHAVVRTSSIRSAGGRTRVGVTAYEGDWASAGDRFLVNGKAQTDPSPDGRADNFFVAHAAGAVTPRHLNNMSVDAKTVEVSDETIRAGDTTAELTFTGGRGDAYLVRVVAVSTPRPQLRLAADPDPPAAHPATPLTHTFRITNVGDAPAVDVRLRGSGIPSCERDLGTVRAAQTVVAQCAARAGDDDYQVSATATGRSLAGDELTAKAMTTVDILHPAVALTKTAAPATVLAGQRVGYEIVLRNTGDTPLTGVVVDDDRTDDCDRSESGPLGPGQTLSVMCAGTAPDHDFTTTATGAGTDKLGKRVTASGHATVTVLHPFLAPAVLPPEPPEPAASVGRAELPVPAPVFVAGLSMIAMLVTVSAITGARRSG